MYRVFKRTIDFVFSAFALILLLPVFSLITVIIIMESGLPVFFLQERVGKHNKPFNIIKFRTMIRNADKLGLSISVNQDSRITSAGRFLRKFKLDELPQLINVLVGHMSIVGPRPEVRRYTDFYPDEYERILEVKPGITDYASIMFRDEAALLKSQGDAESIYVKQIMPEKIRLYKQYIEEMSFSTDLKIIFSTIRAIFK